MSSGFAWNRVEPRMQRWQSWTWPRAALTILWLLATAAFGLYWALVGGIGVGLGAQPRCCLGHGLPSRRPLHARGRCNCFSRPARRLARAAAKSLARGLPDANRGNRNRALRYWIDSMGAPSDEEIAGTILRAFP
jgi:hypothetical protein